jgi:hypothetical protein
VEESTSGDVSSNSSRNLLRVDPSNQGLRKGFDFIRTLAYSGKNVWIARISPAEKATAWLAEMSKSSGRPAAVWTHHLADHE